MFSIHFFIAPTKQMSYTVGVAKRYLAKNLLPPKNPYFTSSFAGMA